MYSQYITGEFEPLRHELPHSPKSVSIHNHKILEETASMFGGILKQYSLNELDTGDILLMLIILFLFLEGDNLDVVITLGLMFLFGLNG